MATATDIMNAAGREIGELRADRSFGTTELAQLLVSLNQMISGWSQGQSAIFQMSQDSITLTGAASYFIGPAGAANVTRPIRVVAAYTLATTGLRRPARIVTAEEFAKILDNAATGSFIDLLFPDYAMPAVELRLWPVPPSGTLIVNSLRPLTEFALVSTAAALPPGYEEALVANFAVKIAPDFGKAAPQHIVELAVNSRKAIAATNSQLLMAQGAA